MRFLGKFYTTDFWYTSKLRVHPEIGNVWQTGEQYRILCQKNEICIYPTGGNEVKKKKQAFQSKLFHERRKQWFARNLMSLYSGKRVWLYFDSHDSLDNGYYQFQHDFQKRDGIKRYYVYHADNPELIKGRFTKRQEHALVVFNSVRHKCLMAAAEKVLVAYIGRSTYLPFDPNTYQYYSDLFHYEVIYLQHGVMHAKLPDMYSKEKVWQADKIVASTAFEFSDAWIPGRGYLNLRYAPAGPLVHKDSIDKTDFVCALLAGLSGKNGWPGTGACGWLLSFAILSAVHGVLKQLGAEILPNGK